MNLFETLSIQQQRYHQQSSQTIALHPIFVALFESVNR